jgi:hypothetical protein
MRPQRIFLLSPAHLGGPRAALLIGPRGRCDLARRLRENRGVSLGEVYSFVSGLYFRGKLAYASAFQNPPAEVPGVLVIAPGRGLLPPETEVDLRALRALSRISVDPGEPRYRRPLSRAARDLARRSPGECQVVLLGSIATEKYLACLGEVLGARLRFPGAFVGRGDMSRGGLLLRCVDEAQELEYVPLAGAVRRGSRPARLEPRRILGIPPVPAERRSVISRPQGPRCRAGRPARAGREGSGRGT